MAGTRSLVVITINEVKARIWGGGSSKESVVLFFFFFNNVVGAYVSIL